eukprot:jgi/Chlat1/4816/Chrsp31S04864
MDILRQRVLSTRDAVLEKLGGAHAGPRPTDESDEFRQQHDELERLNHITTHNKHFIKDLVRSVDNLCTAGNRYTETGVRLVEFCRGYGTEGPGQGTTLGLACLQYGIARTQLESERDTFHRKVQDQIVEPLRGVINNGHLDEARLASKRYEKVRSDVDALVAQSRQRRDRIARDGSGADQDKLSSIEAKQHELVAVMQAQGEEAAHAHKAVAAAQQREALARLVSMVEMERDMLNKTYNTLDRLYVQLVAEQRRTEQASDGQERTHSPIRRGASSAAAAFDNSSTTSAPPPPSYDDVMTNNMARSADRPSSASTAPAARTNSAGSRATSGVDDLFDLDMGSSAKSEPGSATKAPKPASKPQMLAEVLHDYTAVEPGELSLRKGEYIVVRQTTDSGWSDGQCKGKAGWFPTSYVKVLQEIQPNQRS